MEEKKNVFIENIRGIILKAYDGHEMPVNDWNTAIDKYNAIHHITKGMEAKDIIAQRSEFMQYVKGKVFNKFGDEKVKEKPFDHVSKLPNVDELKPLPNAVKASDDDE